MDEVWAGEAATRKGECQESQPEGETPAFSPLRRDSPEACSTALFSGGLSPMFTVRPVGAPRIGLLPFPGPFPYSPKQVQPS